MIRIIALDLDGTLLDSEKRLSARNRRALEQAAERGVHIVPTTGRFFGMMPQAVRDPDFVRYAITINGAAAYDRVADETIVRDEIPLATAVAIMEKLDAFDIIYDCYRNDWGWITAEFADKAEVYATNEHYLKMVREFRRPVPELKRHLLATAGEGDVQKIMMFSRLEDKDASELRKVREMVAQHFPRILPTSSTWNDLELNIDTANKGNSLRRLAEKLGSSLEECMSFGDGLNDLSMIKAARYSVAMANAVDEVKAAAKFVTATNDEDGVALAIEKAMAEGLM
jgi:Cof subfamily protein (haloacid dehalogenase superfamily)